MFRALGRIGVRAGLAIGLVVLIAGVVVAARLIDDSGNSRVPFAENTGAPTTVDPTAGDDGESSPSPTYTDNAEIEQAAIAFTAAWLRQDQPAKTWIAALAKLSTPQLAASLDGVDPSSVPALRRTGPAQIAVRSVVFAQVRVEMDSGALVLSMLKDGGKWLVDGIDWESA